LEFLYIYMSRFLLHSRRLLGASIVVLLLVIVALSTATRQPALHVLSAPWHTWKAGYMTKAEGHETSPTRSTAPSEMPGEALAVPLPVPLFYVPVEIIAPPPSSIVIESRRLRAPPTLG
jgi:hypothetical protein